MTAHTAVSNTEKGTKRPRGRPPLGAVLTPEGKYELPPEAIDAAAERMLRHREACRERYAATRDGLRIAKPELFKRKQRVSTSLHEYSRGAAANMG